MSRGSRVLRVFRTGTGVTEGTRGADTGGQAHIRARGRDAGDGRAVADLGGLAAAAQP